MSKYFGVYIKLAAIKKQISVDRHEIVVHKKRVIRLLPFYVLYCFVYESQKDNFYRIFFL